MVIVSVFAFTMSYSLLLTKLQPLRVSVGTEELGLDISQHGEFL
jgi:Amt family ammonium transporter